MAGVWFVDTKRKMSSILAASAQNGPTNSTDAVSIDPTAFPEVWLTIARFMGVAEATRLFGKSEQMTSLNESRDNFNKRFQADMIHPLAKWRGSDEHIKQEEEHAQTRSEIKKEGYPISLLLKGFSESDLVVCYWGFKQRINWIQLSSVPDKKLIPAQNL